MATLRSENYCNGKHREWAHLHLVEDILERLEVLLVLVLQLGTKVHLAHRHLACGGGRLACVLARACCRSRVGRGFTWVDRVHDLAVGRACGQRAGLQ